MLDLEKVRVDMDDPSFMMSEMRVYSTLHLLIEEIESLRTEQQGWQDLFTLNSRKMLEENENLKTANTMMADQLKQFAT